MSQNLTTWESQLHFASLKEAVLQIFIALESPASLTGYEPANLGSNGKNNNH
jgi:hypothetical protein